MRHLAIAIAIAIAAAAAAALGLSHCQGSMQAQTPHGHPGPKPPGAATASQAAPLDRADPHVAQLFNILRNARAQGPALDMARLQAKLRDVARAHAIEYEIDPAASEQMIMMTAHNAWAAAQAHPENLESLDDFNTSIGAK